MIVYGSGSKQRDVREIYQPQIYLDLQNLHGRGQEAADAVRREMEKSW